MNVNSPHESVQEEAEIPISHYQSITGKFLTMYYNTLQSEPEHLKRFYHVDSEIDRTRGVAMTDFRDESDVDGSEFEPLQMTMAEKLNFLKGDDKILLIDIKKAIHEKAICNSILIRVWGIIRLQNDRNIVNDRTFEQIFFISKVSNGFWLIQNDILSYNDNEDINVSNQEQEGMEETINSPEETEKNRNSGLDRRDINHQKIPKFGIDSLPRMSPNHNLNPNRDRHKKTTTSTWSSITGSKVNKFDNTEPEQEMKMELKLVVERKQER